MAVDAASSKRGKARMVPTVCLGKLESVRLRRPPARDHRRGPYTPILQRALVAALALLLTPRALPATDCTDDTGASPCVDFDTLWMPPGRARFVSIAAAENSAPGRPSVAVASSYLSRPVVLIAPSPDLGGRKIAVVEYACNVSLLSAYALDERFELAAVLPATLAQSGTGVAGITAQTAAPLPDQALRDPRLGMGILLLRMTLPHSTRFALKSRLQVSVPLGQEQHLAGERSFVSAPTVALALERGAWFAGGEFGARLRQVSRLADARVGSQLVSSLGVGFELLRPEVLAVALEAWMLPTLVAQDSALPPHDPVSTSLVPAEWLASLRFAPLWRGNLAFQLGGGGPLPLSSERAGGGRTRHFAGVTTPRFRIVAALRYAPTAAALPSD